MLKDAEIARPVKILIVDDHLLFADGLELILSQLEFAVETSISSDANAVLDNIEWLRTFDLLLVDLQMPEMSGIGFLKKLREQVLELKVIVISGSEDMMEIRHALNLGAMGFIAKGAPTPEMLRGIKVVLAGQKLIPEALRQQSNWSSEEQFDDKNSHASIGPRQLEVLRLMSEGLQNKQIAADLGVSVSAVKRHIELLFKALNVSNRTACVQAAMKQELI